MPPLLPAVLHPIFVHAPLVLLPLALVALLLRRRLPWAPQAAQALLVLAASTAVLAAVAGIVEKNALEDDLAGTPKGEWLEWHAILGLATTLLTVVVAIAATIRRLGFPDRHARLWVAAVALATLLVAAAGWLGGAVVHEPDSHATAAASTQRSWAPWPEAEAALGGPPTRAPLAPSHDSASGPIAP